MSDNQTDKNLRTVFSPLGEKFEVTPANYVDLTRNANWTEHKPHPDAVREYCEKTGTELPAELSGESAPAAAPAAPPAPETPPVVETADAAGEQTVSGEAPEEVLEADEEAAEDEDGKVPELKTEPHHFADMDRDAVRAHIETNFPGTEIDGRKGRDALVAQALELAAARAA
jgi:hypothetical protein